MGRMLTRLLHKQYRIIGIDERGARHMPKDVTVHALNIERRAAEDIFRRNRVDAVVHLTPYILRNNRRLSLLNSGMTSTSRVLDFCHRHEVHKLVLVSSANIYGASAENNQFLTEEAPLLAGQRFPTMRGLVEVDMYTQSYFWKHPEIDTVILRPVNIIGRLNNPASHLLQMKYTPVLLGFDPMVQVMSPEDALLAVKLALKPGVRGVFNVAGPPPVPLYELVRRLGHHIVPLPDGLARTMMGILTGLGAEGVPSAELDYLKYVCMVDDSRARDVMGYAPERTLDQTLEPLRTL